MSENQCKLYCSIYLGIDNGHIIQILLKKSLKFLISFLGLIKQIEIDFILFIVIV